MEKSREHERLLRWLEERLTPERLHHSEGVARTAAWLARQHGADVEKAYLAGLLHDNARDCSPEELVRLAREFGMIGNGDSPSLPILLHAPVGAERVRRELGITDPEVLRAIRLHITGAEEMSLLDKVLLVADAVSPDREYPGVGMLRRLARRHLDRAVVEILENTIRYLESRGDPVDPNTFQVYQAWKRRVEEAEADGHTPPQSTS